MTLLAGIVWQMLYTITSISPINSWSAALYMYALGNVSYSCIVFPGNQVYFNCLYCRCNIICWTHVGAQANVFMIISRSLGSFWISTVFHRYTGDIWLTQKSQKLTIFSSCMQFCSAEVNTYDAYTTSHFERHRHVSSVTCWQHRSSVWVHLWALTWFLHCNIWLSFPWSIFLSSRKDADSSDSPATNLSRYFTIPRNMWRSLLSLGHIYSTIILILTGLVLRHGISFLTCWVSFSTHWISFWICLESVSISCLICQNTSRSDCKISSNTENFVHTRTSPREAYYCGEAWCSVGGWGIHPATPVQPPPPPPPPPPPSWWGVTITIRVLDARIYQYLFLPAVHTPRWFQRLIENDLARNTCSTGPSIALSDFRHVLKKYTKINF